MGTTEIKSFLTDAFYYEGNSFEDGIFAKEVCDNLDYLESVATNLNKPIATTQDLYIFMWCLSFKEFANEIDCYEIDSSIKPRVLKLSNLINPNGGSFIKYINKNYLEIFDKEKHEKLRWHSFFDYALDLCYDKYSSGIKEEIFRFFEDKYWDYVLSHFKSCSNYYAKHRESFETLFRDLKNTRLFDDQIYLRFLIDYVNRDDPFLCKQAEFICDRTINEIRAMNVDEDSQEFVEVYTLIQDYYKLANLYQLTCTNDYNALVRDLQRRIGAFIEKHGVHYQIGPIDLTPAINFLKADSNPYRFIGITHGTTKDGKFRNVLDGIIILDNKKNPLSEVMNDPSRNRSKKYPFYKQDSMQISLWIRTRLINLIMQDDQLTREFRYYLHLVTPKLSQSYFSNIIDIENETIGEFDCLLMMQELAKKSQFEAPFGKALVYSTSLAICTTIEKILRNVALKQVKNDTFFDSSKVTLVRLLAILSKNTDLSEGLKYYLEFYLVREIAFKGLDLEKPGLNIRNDLMHGQDDAFETTNYEICLILFYFLTSLINDLAVGIKADKQ